MVASAISKIGSSQIVVAILYNSCTVLGGLDIIRDCDIHTGCLLGLTLLGIY